MTLTPISPPRSRALTLARSAVCPTSDVSAVAHPPRRASQRRGFTLIEIAMCLAVIAFALIAVVGVMPRGMLTQRENRADTVIAQDGMYWMEALRSGTNGVDELMQFVEKITIRRPNQAPVDYSPMASPPPGFYSGREIIGLLCTSNAQVHAIVQAISGPAVDRATNDLVRDVAFKYQMEVHIAPAAVADASNPEVSDVALVFRWPLTRSGVGGRSRVFRAQIAQREGWPQYSDVGVSGDPLFFFDP
jgi:prepilin-type N-terminal cleavage/methylation domain-containing protein